MFKITVLVLILNSISVQSSGIYHEKTKVTFRPDELSAYFGYSVVLNPYGLIVGAPKAKNRDKAAISSGLVFNCSLHGLDKVNNVMCHPIGPEGRGPTATERYRRLTNSFFRDDMWFGATIASVTSGKLLICAPRWAEPYSSNHLLANGVCFLHKRDRDYILYPLNDRLPFELDEMLVNISGIAAARQAYMADGRRKEFGAYGTHLNFYAYGQAGMSIKETGNNSVIIGAPGLLQWTGGIIKFNYSPDEDSVLFSKQPTTNPYNTKDLEPDDYFGYSVDAGIFEVNGQILYVGGAPRSKSGYGQVLIFESANREMDPLNIRAKVRGPQLGAYFGASLCCTDIDGDGVADLLVGAPNFVKKDGELPYDQGAVFVYMTKQLNSSFILESSGYVFGSGESGARFGTVIADLGDVDGDGFKDVAIGAPWENEGKGVVYIYRGNAQGLVSQYVQRIVADNSRSFGISISKGLDVDGNNCNDVAIGAHRSGTVYIYRCVPTLKVNAVIKVPDAMNLPQNATGFTALFCVNAPAQPLWPHVKLGLMARIIIDPEGSRAMITGDSQYKVTAKPGNELCDEQTVEVKPDADLSKPISIKFELEPDEQLKPDSDKFMMDAARMSENSHLHTSFLIQLTRDCGEDLVCTPWLVMSLEALDNPYIPGTGARLGAKITVLNKEEPAYGAKINITLPMPPKRIPSACSLQDLNMTCEVPAPLLRDEEIQWEVELEYTLKESEEQNLKIVAVLEDHLYNKNISDESVKELVIDITPEANFSVSGKPLPNATMPVTRDKFEAAENVSFVHYFEVTNFGPSDWYHLEVELLLSEKVNLSSPIRGCVEEAGRIECGWSLPAKVTLPVVLQLQFDLGRHGGLLEEVTSLNLTTSIVLRLKDQNKTATITTTLVLDPAPPIWPQIVGLIAGTILLAAIVYLLYRFGFFSRQQRERLKKLKEESTPLAEEHGSSTGSPSNEPNESTHELLFEDSD